MARFVEPPPAAVRWPIVDYRVIEKPRVQATPSHRKTSEEKRSWIRDGPRSWIVTLLITEILTALFLGSVFWALAEIREGERFSQAERLENLRYVRSAVAEPDIERQRRFVSLDLRGMDLSGIDLRQANMFGARLEGVYLFGADLSAADLTWAELRNADLSHASFVEAILIEADLSNVTLHEVDFTGADLREADLSGARVSRNSSIVLTGADMTGANLEDTDLAGAYWDDDEPPLWPADFIPPANAVRSRHGEGQPIVHD